MADKIVPIGGGNAAALVLKRIPGGRFLMGSCNGLPHAPEGPEHLVEVKEFLMAEAPVTGMQFEAVMGVNPSQFQGDRELPVETVSWTDACEFCVRVSRTSGMTVRLPSEAEWEYACRAGSTNQYHFGDLPAELSSYAWYENNSPGHTAPVRRKKPNGWGLFDINGNVWEWCLDLWHEDYTGAPCDGSPWLGKPPRQPRHCVRGGAWDMDAFRCRSSYRSYDWEEIGTSRTGFRVVAEV
jgi:formylglycine-generating enzyme required for sulfatase activity